jgi:Ca2+-binding RTX toxin-like protein
LPTVSPILAPSFDWQEKATMEELDVQDVDLFKDADPGIAFSHAQQTWTITEAVVVSSSNNDGVFSEFDGSTLINHGSILSNGAGHTGLTLLGDDSFIASSEGARIVGAGDGIVVDSKTAGIDNHGSVVGLTNIGVDFGVHSDHITLDNSGSIYGRNEGVRAYSNVDGGIIHNAGEIASNGDGIDVFTNDGLTTTIDNAAGGTLRGAHHAIAVTAGQIALDNHGTLIGGIDTSTGSVNPDVIVNHGKIIGDVLLDAGNDVFTGTGGTSGNVFGEGGNDSLTGGSGADGLFGGSGNDRLIGAAGNDTLDGGSGLDTLTGGRGKDQFVFRSDLSPGLNLDRITDFTVHVDKIFLDQTVFHGIGHGGVLPAGLFHVGAGAHDANDHIIYNPHNGFLIYDANGSHPGGTVHFATLAPHLGLTHADLLVSDVGMA